MITVQTTLGALSFASNIALTPSGETTFSATLAPVPEPSSSWELLTLLLGLGAIRAVVNSRPLKNGQVERVSLNQALRISSEEYIALRPPKLLEASIDSSLLRLGLVFHFPKPAHYSSVALCASSELWFESHCSAGLLL